MDPLSSILLSGIIYDLIKYGTKTYYEISKEALLGYSSKESDITKLTLVLEENQVNINTTKNEILELLENDERVNNIINTVNCNITYNNCEVTNKFYDRNDKEKIDINDYEFTLEVFGNHKIIGSLQTILLGIFVFSMVYFRSFEYLFFILLVLLAVYFIIPRYIPNSLISIYNDSFSVGNNKTYYKNIRRYSEPNSGYFYYYLHNDKTKYTLHFKSYDEAIYLYDKIKNFMIITERHIPRN